MNDYYQQENCWLVIGIVLLVFLLLLFILINCYFTENFTAPGLTLIIPPSWWVSRAGKKYNKKDWESQMYLDRYPFYDAQTNSYLSTPESDYLASVYRFWRI